MKNLEHIKGLYQLPKFISEDWIEHAMKLDKSQMTPEQRMHFEMMLAKAGSIVSMQKEEKRQAKKEMAKKMKTKGISNSDIQELTDLTIEEIENL